MTEELSPAALLRELIRIPSVSSISNRPVIEFARGVLQPYGWHFRELPYRDSSGTEKVNLLATPPWQTADDFSVDLPLCVIPILYGHSERVPLGELELCVSYMENFFRSEGNSSRSRV